MDLFSYFKLETIPGIVSSTWNKFNNIETDV